VVGKRIYSRYKKYPALAANEIFSPYTSSIEPLFICGETISASSSFLPWIFTTELICSESFIATSPSNLLPIANAQDFLLKKFGRESSVESHVEKIKEDILNFSLHTAHNSGQLFRRTILLIPAMTTRTQDFTLLGQSLFLSTGITTVFCNAAPMSLDSCGLGQSCFIGQGSWDFDLHTKKELDDVGPYHGVLPGIFQQNTPKHGCLDKDEQAMVIVDIDPIYAAPRKPRQQDYPQSLSLVAYLPIIESDRITKCPDDKQDKVIKFWHSFKRILNSKKLRNNSPQPELNTSLLTQSDMGELLNLLVQLERLVITDDHKKREQSWLHKRNNAFQKHYKSHPQVLPPPVAIDWLWVDTGGDIPIPKIEIPPYTSLQDDI